MLTVYLQMLKKGATFVTYSVVFSKAIILISLKLLSVVSLIGWRSTVKLSLPWKNIIQSFNLREWKPGVKHYPVIYNIKNFTVYLFSYFSNLEDDAEYKSFHFVVFPVDIV